ncbi:MAG: winged helix-turn-helix domain-containing protein [Gemmataceae bacterium]|nr:winged helix-turn-helix domain-containing protein [Gemmataceae bacterium]
MDPNTSLGLQLDPTRHRATRDGKPCADLGGNCRLWRILVMLAERHGSYVPKRDLIGAVWDDLGAVSIEDGTLWSAISKLRRFLMPLDLTVRHTKGLGYRLVAQTKSIAS